MLSLNGTREAESLAITAGDLARIGGDGLNDFGGGRIGELIVYQRALTPAEMERIESYLGINYRDSDADLSAADNVWTLGSGFDNDVAGIAKDSFATLDKRIGRSASGQVLAISTDATFEVKQYNDSNDPTEEFENHVFGARAVRRF